MTQLFARPAVPDDVPKLAELVTLAAIAMGDGDRIDPSRPHTHMASKLKQGACFVIEEDRDIIGVITTNPIDLAHRLAHEAIEVTHTFVRRDRRSYKAIALLFDAVEAYADANKLVLFFHELDFPAALRKEPSQSERLAKLYKRRRYRQAGFSLARHPAPDDDGKPPYVRVGNTYLYEPGLSAAGEPAPSGVRLPCKPPDEGDT